MVHFKVRGHNRLITSNFKVMFRTLASQPALDQVSPLSVLLFRLRCKILRQRCDHAMLVRNPYRRLVSFFQDKFRYNLELGRTGRRYEEWQTCQKLFFPAAGIEPTDDTETIKARLSSFRFSDFLKVLPGVFHRDLHLLPQSQSLFLGFVISVPRQVFTEILKMEESKDLKRLADHFQVDLNIRLNQTSEQHIEDWFSLETCALVNQIYAADFHLFNYGALRP